MAPPIPVRPPVAEAPVIKDFTPQPKQKKRRLRGKRLPRVQLPADKTRLKKLSVVLGIVVVVVGLAAGFVNYQLGRDKSDVAFNDALKYSLGIKQVEVATVNGTTTSVADLDFTEASNPIVSTQIKTQIAGEPAELAGYGTNKDTFVSYSKLPASVSPAISSVTQNSWIQLRTAGTDPVGVPGILTRAGDPRYQLFGPIIFANATGKTRDQLYKYLIGQNLYDYRSQPITHDKIGDQKVIIYTLHINVGSLKVANQTAARSFGMAADDIQQAIDSLDYLRGATITFAINASNHRPVQMTVLKNGQRSTLSYTKFNTASLPAQPQTKLAWANFANAQFQIEAQAAAKQTPADQDTSRKAQLDTIHKALAAYFTQAASYPSLANINDQGWVKTNLLGLDPDVLRDPLAINLTLLATPKAGGFAYQPLPESGKGSCDNTAAAPCAHYKLTALLSTKQAAVVQDP